MRKRNIQTALKSSLESEEDAINARFEKAEAIFGGKTENIEGKKNAGQPKKPEDKAVKVIRDSFTMPQTDYGLIGELKKRSLRLGYQVNKSEIIRAGLQALDKMNEDEFIGKLTEIEKIKTGRPKQN